MNIKNIIARIRIYFRGQHQWKLKEGHIVTPVFISDGVQYFKMHDVFNTYTERAMSAWRVYEEWKKRCDDDFLRGWVSAIKGELNKPEIKIVEVINLVTRLQERLDFIVPTSEIIWKMAAVTFFDANESPYDYEENYAKEKIARWKKDKKMKVFFCMKELNELIPLPDLSEGDLRTCLMMTEQMNQLHIQDLIGKILQEDQNKDFYKELTSRIATEPIHMN